MVYRQLYHIGHSINKQVYNKLNLLYTSRWKDQYLQNHAFDSEHKRLRFLKYPGGGRHSLYMQNWRVPLSGVCFLGCWVFTISRGGKTLNDSGPRYLEDFLKFYHQSRTLRSSRDHLCLEEPNFNVKTCDQRAFSVAAPPTMEQAPLWNSGLFWYKSF